MLLKSNGRVWCVAGMHAVAAERCPPHADAVGNMWDGESDGLLRGISVNRLARSGT